MKCCSELFFEACMEILKMHKQSPTMTRLFWGKRAIWRDVFGAVRKLSALYLIDKRIFRAVAPNANHCQHAGLITSL